MHANSHTVCDWDDDHGTATCIECGVEYPDTTSTCPNGHLQPLNRGGALAGQDEPEWGGYSSGTGGIMTSDFPQYDGGGHWIHSYVADADHWCHDCAASRYESADGDDYEGNPIGAVMDYSQYDDENGTYCGGCLAELWAPYVEDDEYDDDETPPQHAPGGLLDELRYAEGVLDSLTPVGAKGY